jgi:hypothetical protein
MDRRTPNPEPGILRISPDAKIKFAKGDSKLRVMRITMGLSRELMHRSQQRLATTNHSRLRHQPGIES